MSEILMPVELTAIVAGFYLLVTGAGFFMSTEFYVKMTEMGAGSDPVLINLSGAAHFLVGASVICVAYPWSGVTEIAVGSLGAVAALKGASLIVIPELALKAGPQSASKIRLMAVLFVLTGLIFISLGARLL